MRTELVGDFILDILAPNYVNLEQYPEHLECEGNWILTAALLK